MEFWRQTLPEETAKRGRYKQIVGDLTDRYRRWLGLMDGLLPEQ
jgi:hypothetical protein